jgi:hypothetical protein
MLQHYGVVSRREASQINQKSVGSILFIQPEEDVAQVWHAMWDVICANHSVASSFTNTNHNCYMRINYKTQ